MENKEINLKITSNIDAISKDVKSLNKNFDNTSDDLKSIKKSAENAEGGVKSLASGFKGMGLAIKAIGIGLVLEAFNMFKDILGKNQKVVDGFNAAIGALSIAFNDLIGFVMDSFPEVIKIFKDVFQNPTTYLKKFGDLIKENLIERFNSFLDTIGYIGDAISKVFSGDFAGAMESVKKAGKESIDVLTGVNNTVDRAGEAINDAANAIANYAVNTFKAAEANIKLQNSALIAAAQQAKLVEQYDRQAESLRQIRDNDLLSIDERIKANDKLGVVLEKQQKAMLKVATLQKDAAAATYSLNKTTENRVALINAEANVEGVLAQIKGLKSEQLANENSLTKESNDLIQSQIDTKNELNIKSKQFDSEQQLSEVKKIEKQKEVITLQQQIDLAELERKRKLYADGTQSRVDAENEFLIKKQDTDNALITNQKETDRLLLEQEKAVADGKKAIQESSFQVAEGGISLLKGLFEKNKGIQKGLILAESAVGLAKIVISTQAANAADTAAAALMGPAGAAYLATKIPLNYVSAGIGAAANIAATSKALSALGGGGSASKPAMGSASGGGAAAPRFNVVGNSGVNQLAQTLGGTSEQAPIQAYVVASNVTSAQSMNRNIVNNASLG